MQFFKKIKKKFEKNPAYVKFMKFLDKVTECILTALLACLSTIGPVWNFLFVKTPNYDETNGTNNKISQDVITHKAILGVLDFFEIFFGAQLYLFIHNY